jgi:hypothetical protein
MTIGDKTKIKSTKLSIMKKSYFVSAYLIIISTFNCLSQEKYSVVGYFGLCDMRFVHPENLLYPGDQYKTYFSYKGGLYYDIISKNTPILYPSVGITFTTKYQLNYMGVNSIPYFGVTRDRFITLDLPIALNYKMNKWLKIKGGINGSAFIMGLNQGPTDRQVFTYGPFVGLSIRYRQYSLNLEYVRDVNDMLRHLIIENASYRSSVLHLGIGYHFSSFKQFKGVLR